MAIPAQETNPLRLAWHAGKVVYEDLLPFVGMSLLTWLSFLLVVPSFPAMAALCEVARLAIDAYAVSMRHWREALREYFGRGWLVGLITVGITFILVANVLFYSRQSGVWRYGTIFWLWMLGIWALTALYVIPITVLQEETRSWRLVRNAFYLATLRPIHSLVALVWIGLVSAFSLVLPIFLLVLPAYIAVYTTLLARQLILDIQRQHQRKEKEDR